MKNYPHYKELFSITVFLSAIFLLTSTTIVFSQTSWNADAIGGTSDWNIASNWTNGVPSSSEMTTIPNCAICPVIASPSQQTGYLQILSGGRLTITSDGELTVKNPGNAAMKIHQNGRLTLDHDALLSVKDFWGEGIALYGTLDNFGDIEINGGHTAIYSSVNSNLNNFLSGKIYISGDLLNYGIFSNETVLNQGKITIEKAIQAGLYQEAGTITNHNQIILNDISVNGIFHKDKIHNFGEITITNALTGVFSINSDFQNHIDATLNIAGAVSLHKGISSFHGIFNNSGTVNISNATNMGIESSNNMGFDNFGIINLLNTGIYGILNTGSSFFKNHPCALIQSSNVIVNYASFQNRGVIIEEATGNSMISTNDGVIHNYESGIFQIDSGSSAITNHEKVVWTGCLDNNWEAPKNWSTRSVPGTTIGKWTKVVVPNVSSWSGNFPVVTTVTPTTTSVTIESDANVTVAASGRLVCNFIPFMNMPFEFIIDENGHLEIESTGEVFAPHWLNNGTVNNQGTLKATGENTGPGTFYNGGTVNNFGDFHCINDWLAGGYLSNSGSFNNFLDVNIITAYGGGFYNTGQFSNALSATTKVIGAFGTINNDDGAMITNDGTIDFNASGGAHLKNKNNSTFTNNGILTIHTNVEDGLECNNSTFTNDGTVTLNSTNIKLYDGNFSNNGIINIKAPASDGVINGGVFTNSGMLTVEDSDIHHGVLNLGDGDFYNMAEGEMYFIHTSNGFINFGYLENAGLLDVNTTNFARGLENQGTVINQLDGHMTIRNTVNEGVANFEDFTNKGTILVENISNSYGIVTGGNFKNKSTGVMTTNDTHGPGVWVFGGMFSNEGDVEVDGTDGNGMSNWANSTNLASGHINIKNAGDNGLRNTGVFNNIGLLKIDAPAKNGIRNLNFKFDNRPGGIVEIKNVSSGNAIHTSDGFFNTGTVTIQNSPNSIFIENLGYLNNHPCAEFHIDGKIDNQNSLNNEGLFKTTFAGTNSNTGVIDNTGIIEDVFNSFNGVPILNSQIIAAPVSAMLGASIHDALQLGTIPPGFDIGATWYTDPGLTIPGATYSLFAGAGNDNILSPLGSLGAGTHRLYFEVKDLIQPDVCTKIVSLDLTLYSTSINFPSSNGLVARFTFQNYPNPFVQSTTLEFTLPKDAQAKLIIFDMYGKEIETLFDGFVKAGVNRKFTYDGNGLGAGFYFAKVISKSINTNPLKLVKVED